MLDTIDRRLAEPAAAARVHTACPICSGRNLQPRWTVNGFSIVRCRTCSLVFVRDIVTPEELTAHYSAPDRSYDDDNSDCLSYYYQRLRGLIAHHFPLPGRILDIGCSAGQFLDAMEGWDRHGNEVSALFSGIAQKRYGDRVVTGLFEDYPLRKHFFDVITLQDVFDHLRDPIAILKKCNAMLKPGGLIVIKVHNISCLYAKAMGSKFYAIMPPTHLFYYDRSTLEGVLARTGFHLVDSRFIGHLLKLRIVFYRLARGNKNSLAYRIFQKLEGTSLGNIAVRKNLHDIITVMAVKT